MNNLLRDRERPLAEAIGGLIYCNPFSPKRRMLERTILGDAFRESGEFWSLTGSPKEYQENIRGIAAATEAMLGMMSDRLRTGSKYGVAELSVYEDLVIYRLFEAYRPEFLSALGAGPDANYGFYKRFADEFSRFLPEGEREWPSAHRPEHIFAIFHQIHRAFVSIFDHIVGGSQPIAELRAAIWQSIFTHDIKRYNRCLHSGIMRDSSTLITGPSGTGKELVARAIAMAQFLPFDSRRHRFPADPGTLFQPLHIAALPSTLLESELFGHAKGAFTGALGDRIGRLENCSEWGTVFLDEVGEIEPLSQVKLLRVLQNRLFQRLGETTERRFHGKIISATNRHLPKEIENGSFRADLYYRLCSDVIVTPSLAEQLHARPDELPRLIGFVTNKLVGEEEASELTRETCRWIERELPQHAWPGNFRELEQCVRNILIRGKYRPSFRGSDHTGDADALSSALEKSELSADDLLDLYCRVALRKHGGYAAAARVLGIDRRTLKFRAERVKV